MLRKIKIISVMLLSFGIGSLGYSTNEVNNKSNVDIDVVEANKNEFSVIINAEEGKEFVAYDIEVVDGQAVVNLMVEDEE